MDAHAISYRQPGALPSYGSLRDHCGFASLPSVGFVGRELLYLATSEGNQGSFHGCDPSRPNCLTSAFDAQGIRHGPGRLLMQDGACLGSLSDLAAPTADRRQRRNQMMELTPPPSLRLSTSPSPSPPYASRSCLPAVSSSDPHGPCNSRPDRHSSGERQPPDVHIAKPSAASARQSGMRCRNLARCIAHLTSPCLFRSPLACSLQPPVIILRRRCVRLAQDKRHSRSKVLCTCRCVRATAGPPTRQTTCT